MVKLVSLITGLALASYLSAQVEPQAGQWKTLFEGEKIGRGLLRPIQPVNARVFRFFVTRALPGIQLEELMLFSE